MKATELDAMSERLRAMDDRALLQLVSIDAEQYREDVLDRARDELRKRGLDAPTPEQFLTSLSPAELKAGPLFCARCHGATTDERFPTSGETFFRRLLFIEEDECSDCGSVVADHCVTILRTFVVTRLAQFRIKRAAGMTWPAAPSILASRKLRE